MRETPIQLPIESFLVWVSDFLVIIVINIYIYFKIYIKQIVKGDLFMTSLMRELFIIGKI